MRASVAILMVLASLVRPAQAHSDAAGETALEEELSEIVVTAPEPRYVAPTTRDRIGRVWVPVHIDGQGPFRLVLDTGAQRSAVIPQVATALGIPLDRSLPVRMHGVTGSAVVPTVQVDTLRVGDVWMRSERMPVVEDAFGGAEGLLGIDGLQDRRIYIDFRADYVDIAMSRNRRPAAGFITVPVLRASDRLLRVKAQVGGVETIAILDTGAQATVANDALHDALRRQVARSRLGDDQIRGATGDVMMGTGARVSRIQLGALQIREAHVTFSDLPIFTRWDLADKPALLVGMDLLGLVDTLVIDYLRREVHIKPRRGG